MKQIASFLITLYFVIVSAVALFTLMFSGGELVNIGLKSYIFPAANAPSYIGSCDADAAQLYLAEDESETDWLEKCEQRRERSFEDHKRQQASNAVRSLALVLVSLPIFLLHFNVVRKEWKRRD